VGYVHKSSWVITKHGNKWASLSHLAWQIITLLIFNKDTHCQFSQFTELSLYKSRRPYLLCKVHNNENGKVNVCNSFHLSDVYLQRSNRRKNAIKNCFAAWSSIKTRCCFDSVTD